MERIFRALADPSRRRLLDALHHRDGQTLHRLESQLAMSRFGVMKHLRVLEAAGLITTRRAGREKFHYLNPVPIRRIHDRWIRKYAEPIVAAMSTLKATLEGDPMNTPDMSTRSTSARAPSDCGRRSPIRRSRSNTSTKAPCDRTGRWVRRSNT